MNPALLAILSVAVIRLVAMGVQKRGSGAIPGPYARRGALARRPEGGQRRAVRKRKAISALPGTGEARDTILIEDDWLVAERIHTPAELREVCARIGIRNRELISFWTDDLVGRHGPGVYLYLVGSLDGPHYLAYLLPQDDPQGYYEDQVFSADNEPSLVELERKVFLQS